MIRRAFLLATTSALALGTGLLSSGHRHGPKPKPTPTPSPTPTPTPVPTPTPTPAPTGTFSAATANAQTYDGPLFAPASPWNTPIPSTAKADPGSDAMIANLQTGFEAKHPFEINRDSYAVPIFYADASTPRVPVKASTNWWPGFASVPIPPEAKPDPAGDQHLVVWDVPNDEVCEYYGAVNSNGAWSAKMGIRFAANGPGYQDGLWLNSARAYGGSLAAGAIRYAEMKAGVIPHALAMAYQYPRGDFYARGVASDGTLSIASHCDNNAAFGTTVANIPEGARIRLKASVDIAARANGRLSTAVIGHALQIYGAFVVDHAGAPTLYAENLLGKAVSWTGVLDALDARPFLASDFEVLSLPVLTAAGAK